jgi:hypothetical protein
MNRGKNGNKKIYMFGWLSWSEPIRFPARAARHFRFPVNTQHETGSMDKVD